MKMMRSLAFMLALLSLLITNVVAREYSPTTGRYIQFDPTGLDGGWNGFAYVSSDPLGSYDDNGLAQKKPTPSIAPASPIAGGGARSSQWQSIPADLAPYKIPMAGGKGGAGAGKGMMGLPDCPPFSAAMGIVARDGTAVTGFTKHGVDRVIGDSAKRAGTRPDAILDALKNPAKIKEGADSLGRPFKIYTGDDARVVVNPESGKIISTNPLSREGAHLP